MKPVIPLVFRPAGPDDTAYVVRTWIESYRDEQAEMRTSDYEAWMRERINADVLLACHESQSEAILGWIATEPARACIGCRRPMAFREIRHCAADMFCRPDRDEGVGRLHYVYVRRRYRRQGIARALFEQVTGNIVGGETVVTWMTEAGRAIKKSHPNVFRYVPC